METDYLLSTKMKLLNNRNKKKKKIVYNNILKSKLKNILAFSMFLISYYLYYLSLEKCYKGADKCCQKLRWIKKKVIQELSSCTLITALLQFIFYKIISRLH